MCVINLLSECPELSITVDAHISYDSDINKVCVINALYQQLLRYVRMKR